MAQLVKLRQMLQMAEAEVTYSIAPSASWLIHPDAAPEPKRRLGVRQSFAPLVQLNEQSQPQAIINTGGALSSRYFH
jgi:hypothetical protein